MDRSISKIFRRTVTPAAKRLRVLFTAAPATNVPGVKEAGAVSGLDGQPTVFRVAMSSRAVSPRARPGEWEGVTAGGTAQNKTPVTSKPQFQALPSGWTKRLHAGMLAPSTNNDVYLSRATVGPVLTESVMDVAKDGKHAAETLLLTCLFDHTATKSEMPSIKMLKPWLGKTLSNAHLNLEDCIFRACTTTTGFVGRSKAETKRLVHMRGYHKSYNRRCGVLSAFSAVLFFIAEVTPTSTPFLKENAEMRLPLLSSTSRILFSATCALGLRHGGSTVA